MKYQNWLSLIVLYIISFSFVYGQIDHGKVAEFTKVYAATHNTSIEELTVLFNNAKYQQVIIDKMEKPAEGTMTWERYRNIFIKSERITEGVKFWDENIDVLNDVSSTSGIPVEIILGVIGVETFYGKRIGSYRVLDALYTLAFGYPKRSSFFKAELGKFLEMVEQEELDVYSVMGSYAGAIGYCQFMPSSYLAYAKSYQEGGSRDLMQVDDAIASVANYLKVHRWEGDGPIASKINDTINPKTLDTDNVRPRNTLTYYRDNGYVPSGNMSPSRVAALLDFEFEDGHKEYWLGYQNFYVITRYNHSRLYALAVYQLAEAIKVERSKL